jgi:hypothetical protein
MRKPDIRHEEIEGSFIFFSFLLPGPLGNCWLTRFSGNNQLVCTANIYSEITVETGTPVKSVHLTSICHTHYNVDVYRYCSKPL